MITDDLKQRLEKLTEKELNLVKLLIFHYNNFNTSHEMKTGYRFALHHIFHMLDIATLPNIDLRPAVEQQIEKLIKSIEEIDNDNNEIKI